MCIYLCIYTYICTYTYIHTPHTHTTRARARTHTHTRRIPVARVRDINVCMRVWEVHEYVCGMHSRRAWACIHADTHLWPKRPPTATTF